MKFFYMVSIILYLCSVFFTYAERGSSEVNLISQEIKEDKASNGYRGKEAIEPRIPTVVIESLNERLKVGKQTDQSINASNNSKINTNWIEIESWRTAEKDLDVQKSMDKSASFMVVISFVTAVMMLVSIGFSVWAVLLLKSTLKATETANKNSGRAIRKATQANRIAQKNLDEAKLVNTLQLQPWVSIEVAKVERYLNLIQHDESGDERIFFQATIPIINNGKTPMRNTIVEINEFRIHLMKDGMKTPLIGNNEQPFVIQISRPINPGESYPLNLHTSYSISASALHMFVNDQIRFTIRASLRFKDISTASNRHRCITFEALHSSFTPLSTAIVSEDICIDH